MKTEVPDLEVKPSLKSSIQLIPLMIPFNKPYATGKELSYIADAIESGKLSGNGKYTNLCQTYFERRFGFSKTLLTSSCTDALEMAAILADIKVGDEVIMPSYTFVSTANAFVLRGATIRFVDSRTDHPGIDESQLEQMITAKTKAIVVVHYAGVACDMDGIMLLAKNHGLFVIEDAAQAIDSYYCGKDGQSRPLGSIGHMAAFSFHETKNIIAGEGGMLVLNDSSLVKRAEIIWEKGTDRASFFRGEVDKYGWVDIGSSFLPSELTAAFLYAQLENLDKIQDRRKEIWNMYFQAISQFCEAYDLILPSIPSFASNNAHMFYLICRDGKQRDKILGEMKKNGILAVFHYLSLHSSQYFKQFHDGRELPNSDLYSECLIRLPFYFELTHEHQVKVIELLKMSISGPDA